MLMVGVVAGVLAGLLGVGGGIVIVPVLYSALELLEIDPLIRMQIAVATSLATIVPTSISSARSHHKRGSVDFALARRWAAAIILGAAVGAAIAGVVKSDTLVLVFAVIALLVAAHMLILKDGTSLAEGLPQGPVQHIIPSSIGLFSAMMGIGGGTLSVPVLSLFRYPIHRAVGTAAFFGLLIAVPATLGFVFGGWGVPTLPPLSLGYVNLAGLVCIAPTTYLTAPLGAKLAHKLSRPMLRRAFGVFLLITSGRLFWSYLA